LFTAFTVAIFTVTVFAVAALTVATLASLAGISHQRYNRILNAATQCVVETVLEGRTPAPRHGVRNIERWRVF
jgi:hypothetical protein